jgi:hypothetical protein
VQLREPTTPEKESALEDESRAQSLWRERRTSGIRGPMRWHFAGCWQNSVRLRVHVWCATAQGASPTRLAVVVRAARELAFLCLKVTASADAIGVRTACRCDGAWCWAGGCRGSSWRRLRRNRLRIRGWLLLVRTGLLLICARLLLIAALWLLLITPLLLLVVLSRVRWRCFVFLLATGSEHYCDNSKTQCCD